jgi:hypothetical protein
MLEFINTEHRNRLPCGKRLRWGVIVQISLRYYLTSKALKTATKKLLTDYFLMYFIVNLSAMPI